MTEKLHLHEGLHAETWYKDKNTSIAFITLCGLGKRVINKKSDVTYEVLDGIGVFNVGDSCVRVVQAGEKITVPAGTQYQDEGTLMMMATSTPPFNEEDVIVLKD
jgi:mannose-6-phosphate isomerase-like protein (cupin superfamily)